MSNLSKELIRKVIEDVKFSTYKDIGEYIKDMFEDVIPRNIKEIDSDRTWS